MSNVLEVRDLVKVYGGGLASATRALDGVSLTVAKGESVAIMGPSGSGKTTLLNCIATIDRPTSGEVVVDGTDVAHMRQRALADFRRTQLGFIFQDSNLLDTLTCRENIELPLTIVAKGESVAIMGPSGSGKTTLLNCIATIDRPTSGEVVVDGTDVAHMRQRALADFRRTQLGFIFQDSNLLDTLTCRENIELPLTIARQKPSLIRERTEQVAASLNVSDVLDKYPYQVSGGQAQRIAACRAIVADPALVLADEPTGALDSKNSKVLLESFERLNRDYDTTILMVTHDAYAASYCHRVLFIRDGSLFTEIRRGDRSRQEFFQEVSRVISVMGGGDAR